MKKNRTKKVVINRCFGGFGLSDKAYEKLIEWGVPVRAYVEEKRNPKTGLYDIKVPSNEGEVIFDRKAEGSTEKFPSITGNRYWETWLSSKREHPLLIRAVEELGEKANGWAAELEIVEIPADVSYEIDEYDGSESIHEEHRSW